MPIDRDYQALLDEIGKVPGPPMHERPAAEVRAIRDALRASVDRPAGLEVEDRTLSQPGRGLRVRIYRPEGRRPQPALVFFHGGGFVVGNLDTHDSTCCALAAHSGAVVVAVDYRLAPEHPFPAAPDDAFAALQWVAENADDLEIDPDRVGVAGDSAGANLAAVTAIAARDGGGPHLAVQLLFYPTVDTDFDRPSYGANGSGPALTTEMSKWYWRQYVGGDGTTDDPRAAPLKAHDLSRLPPAHVSLAELDPLLDEGMDYAEGLRAAGVAMTVDVAKGLPHGFLRGIGRVPRVGAAFARAVGTARAAFDL